MSSSNNRSSSNNQSNYNRIFTYTSNDDIIPDGTSRIVVHQNVTSIKPNAFLDNTSLQIISIPNSVTSIGEGAFEYCTYLVCIVDVSDSLTSIGRSAFHCCSFLAFITIPDSVTSIGDSAFRYCSSLVSIAMPQSEISIGRSVFHRCTLLDQRQLNNWILNTRIWLCQRFANMPIHQACYSATSQDITSKRLSNITQANNTTLLSTDAMGMTALHVLCCNPNATVHAIRALKDANPNAASIRNVAGMTPLMLLLKCRGQAYDNLFVDGELLPLVGLLELGVDYDVLEMVMGAFDDGGRLVLSLDGIDEESRLFLFMQAALLPDCAFDMVYMLAMMRPELAAKEL